MELTAIDSHTHVQDPAFDDDREAVYERARSEGLGMIVPGYDWTSSERGVAWVSQHDACWAAVGIHPHDATTFQEGDPDRLIRLAQAPKVVGIGEIGLDYHYNNSPPEIQRQAFRRQLAVAGTMGLPPIVHSREAEADTLEIIRQSGITPGVLHCFTGSWEFAEALLALGWYISFAGVISFKNAGPLREVVARVPWDRILIETDAPYLTPVPWRGQRNEPARVIRVAEIVAAQKNCRTKEVFEATMSNTQKLFCL